MKKILYILILFGSHLSFGQTLVMSDGNGTACSGTFSDSGSGGNYGNNENFVFTICPDTPGNSVTVNFTQFETEVDVDILLIYNGSETTLANAIDDYSGTNSPGMITSTSDDGCLTFNFISDASIVFPGWIAEISCIVPCQTINSQIDSASPAPDPENNIKVCIDESISLSGSGTFSSDGSGATYQWDLGDGRTIDGQNATFSYDTPGVYLVNLNIRDTNTSNSPNGCPNTNIINQVIQVSTEPDFSATSAENSEICLGSTTTINGVVQGTYFQAECTPPVSEVTPLPDGIGASYRTSITVDCFDSVQTLENSGELLEICLIIEHSWVDDLDISIISPDGRRIALFEQKTVDSPGGVYLGSPIDGDDETGELVPGIGRQYCFRMDASQMLKDAPFVQDGTPVRNSLQPGNYLPVESFEGLVGSPLNGQWTLEIVDNIELDNGVIFEWNMAFDPSLIPAEFSFTPTFVSETWDANPDIESTNGSSISVRPTTIGQHCYTYRVIDDFGCEYSEEVCIDVFPAVSIGDPTDYNICDNLDEIDGFGQFDLSTKDAEILDGQSPSDYEVSYYANFNDADLGVNPVSKTYNNTSNPQTIFARVEFTGSNALCYAIEDFSLLVELIPDLSLPDEIRVCSDSNGTEEVGDPILDTGLSEIDYSFEWFLDGNPIDFETSASIVATEGGVYTVLVTDVITACTNTASTNVIESGPPTLTARVTSEPFADSNIIEATATGFGDYEYSINGGDFQASGRFENASPGVNTVTARDINGCGSASVNVTVLNYPKFFSPNGDGTNDTWQVKGLGNGSTAIIYIFDRYGKLLKQLNANSRGWDGTVNGDKLPSNDYWFTIDFDDPSLGNRRNFKAHFSLIR